MNDATNTDGNASLKQQLEAADLPEYKDLAGNADAFRTIQEIDQWARNANAKMAQYVSENRPKLEAQMIKRVTEERNKLDPALEPPYPKQSVQQEANQRLSREIESKFAAIQKEKQDRTIAIAGTAQPVPEEAKPATDKTSADPLAEFESKATADQPTDERSPLQKEVSDIVGRARRIRGQSQFEFNTNKKQLIAEAEAKGSKTPVKDAYRAQGEKIKAINKAEDEALSNIFEKHGVPRAAPKPSQSNAGPSMS